MHRCQVEIWGTHLLNAFRFLCQLVSPGEIPDRKVIQALVHAHGTGYPAGLYHPIAVATALRQFHRRSGMGQCLFVIGRDERVGQLCMQVYAHVIRTRSRQGPLKRINTTLGGLCRQWKRKTINHKNRSIVFPSLYLSNTPWKILEVVRPPIPIGMCFFWGMSYPFRWVTR